MENKTQAIVASIAIAGSIFGGYLGSASVFATSAPLKSFCSGFIGSQCGSLVTQEAKKTGDAKKPYAIFETYEIDMTTDQYLGFIQIQKNYTTSLKNAATAKPVSLDTKPTETFINNLESIK